MACILGKNIEEINWKDNIYIQLDKIFFADENEKEVYEISSGTNLFNPPRIILDSIENIVRGKEKINYYSSPLGNSKLRNCITIYESIVSNFQLPISKTAVVTSGAADALRLVFKFLKYKGKKNILVLGPQYSIVYQTMVGENINFVESTNMDKGFLPKSEDIEKILNSYSFDAIFMTQPNNPSGELYSSSELDNIVRLIKEREMFLIYEKIGSDIQINDFNKKQSYGDIFTKYNAWENIFIIDSFSKKRAISGLRVGYVICDYEVEEFITYNRFGDCPSLVANIGLCKDLIFSGIIHYSEVNKVSLDESTKIILNKFKNYYDKSLIDKLDNQVIQRHREYIAATYKTIHDNSSLFIEKLSPYILDYTLMDSGSNILVKFKLPYSDEKEYARYIFNNANIITYPLGCFFIDKDISMNKSQDYWIRVSTALPYTDFFILIDKFKKFLDHESVGETY